MKKVMYDKYFDSVKGCVHTYFQALEDGNSATCARVLLDFRHTAIRLDDSMIRWKRLGLNDCYANAKARKSEIRRIVSQLNDYTLMNYIKVYDGIGRNHYFSSLSFDTISSCYESEV